MISVAGTSYCAEAIESVIREGIRGVQLVREPDNLYDPNAVRVDVNGRKVGYLVRGSEVPQHEVHVARIAPNSVWLVA